MSFASISTAIAALKIPGSSKGVSRASIKGALGDVTAARINVALKKVSAQQVHNSNPDIIDGREKIKNKLLSLFPVLSHIVSVAGRGCRSFTLKIKATRHPNVVVGRAHCCPYKWYTPMEQWLIDHNLTISLSTTLSVVVLRVGCPPSTLWRLPPPSDV